MKRDGHVLFCSDDNGYAQLAVALYSLLATSEHDRHLTVHIFTGEQRLTEEHIRKLRSLGRSYPQVLLEVTDVQSLLDQYRDIFTNKQLRWGVMIWARAMIGELISKDGVIVYLDIDTCVCHDLAQLYDLDMGNAVLAAVYEDAREDGKAGFYWGVLDGGIGHDRYFNSGVLVMNVGAFRREKLLSRLAEWYQVHRDQAFRPDQDALNSLFWNRTIRLHPRFNYSDGWCERQLKYSTHARQWRGNPPREVLEAIVDPAIIHFWGTAKPWVWNHRAEGQRYEQLMREVGLLSGALPGTTVPRQIVGFAYRIWHCLLRRVARWRIKNLA